MTTWILILAIYYGNSCALTQMNIESEELCKKAGETFKSAQPAHANARYVCVKGWEIIND